MIHIHFLYLQFLEKRHDFQFENYRFVCLVYQKKLWLFFFQNHYINGLSLPPLILIFSEMYIHIKSVVHCSWRLCSIKLMMTLDTEQCNLHLFAVSSNSHQVILQFKMSACGLLWQPFSIKSKLTLTLIHFKLLNATCANQYDCNSYTVFSQVVQNTSRVFQGQLEELHFFFHKKGYSVSILGFQFICYIFSCRWQKYHLKLHLLLWKYSRFNHYMYTLSMWFSTWVICSCLLSFVWLLFQMASVCWWYFFSKIIELLDTVGY